VVSFQIHSHTPLIINTAPEDKLRVFDRYESDSRAASGLLKSAEHNHRETTGARSLPGAESALKRHLIG